MNESKRFLILLLERGSFAIPITSLIEIMVPRNVQKDPNLPEICEGRIEYRDTLIPVVNVKKVLKIPGRPGGSLVVMKSSKGLLGLLVDSASELLETKESPCAMPRGVLDSSLQHYAGILKNRDDLVLLLSEDGLLP